MKVQFFPCIGSLEENLPMYSCEIPASTFKQNENLSKSSESKFKNLKQQPLKQSKFNLLQQQNYPQSTQNEN